MKNKVTLYFSTIIILAGAVLSVYQFIPAIMQSPASNPYTSTGSSVVQAAGTVPANDALPTYIEIDAIHVKSTVVPSQEKNGVWPVVNNKANLAINSANPSQYGSFSNTNSAMVLYGHRANIFFNLPSLKNNNVIILSNASVQRVYKVVQVVNVSNTDAAILQTKFSGELILYSCDMFTDSKRYVIIAEPLV